MDEGGKAASSLCRRSHVLIEFHGLLALLSRRAGVLAWEFRADQSLRHEAEIFGIPALEIGIVLVDGSPWPLDLPPPDGAKVDLFPVPEPLPCAGEPCFVADVHLGRLARDLRLLGFDVVWRNNFEDDELVELGLAEGRAVLTRDRGLLYRRAFGPSGSGRGMLLRSPYPYEQLLEVLRRFGLASLIRPFRRCAACGEPLRAVAAEAVRGLVPPIVALRYEDFFSCPACGKVYWKGDHFRSLRPFLERLGADLGREIGRA
jgi:uncharacterized protein with PIN domain